MSWAAEFGCPGVVKLLLEWGTDKDLEIYEGTTPLRIAKEKGRKEVELVTSILKDYYPWWLRREWTRRKCRKIVSRGK